MGIRTAGERARGPYDRRARDEDRVAELPTQMHGYTVGYDGVPRRRRLPTTVDEPLRRVQMDREDGVYQRGFAHGVEHERAMRRERRKLQRLLRAQVSQRIRAHLDAETDDGRGGETREPSAPPAFAPSAQPCTCSPVPTLEHAPWCEANAVPDGSDPGSVTDPSGLAAGDRTSDRRDSDLGLRHLDPDLHPEVEELKHLRYIEEELLRGEKKGDKVVTRPRVDTPGFRTQVTITREAPVVLCSCGERAVGVVTEGMAWPAGPICGVCLGRYLIEGVHAVRETQDVPDAMAKNEGTGGTI